MCDKSGLREQQKFTIPKLLRRKETDGGRGEESITFERKQREGRKVAVRPSGKYIVDLPKLAGPEGALTMAGGHKELGWNARWGN